MAAELKEADKKLLSGMRSEMRQAGKPVGERTLNAIAEAMPRRGGLAEMVRSRGSVSMQANLRAGVKLQLANRAGIYMGAFESGTIRHPVFGNSRVWRAQNVPGHKGEEHFEAEAQALTDAVVAAMLRSIEAAKLRKAARGG